MLSLSGFLCRLWRRTGCGKSNRERAGKNASPEDIQELSEAKLVIADDLKEFRLRD